MKTYKILTSISALGLEEQLNNLPTSPCWEIVHIGVVKATWYALIWKWSHDK